MKLPEDSELCVIDLDWKKQVRRIPLPLRTEQTQTKKKSIGDEDEESTPPVFWCASANPVEATVDLSEPSTFQEAVNGPDQVHWRKAIHAELKSMRTRRGVSCCKIA
ncbi:hypothetical protein Pcac1_g27388 [Phytophthora cactorum]|nr:hypothetical protein Pcac1_g27388 [Phytophthora cactorum]